ERPVDKEPLYAIKESAQEAVVRLERFKTVEDELSWIAEDILGDHSEETSQCVILARTRKVLEAAVTRLEAAGLLASLTIRKSEFTSAPLRWLHAFLRLANARADCEQLRRICKGFYELEG